MRKAILTIASAALLGACSAPQWIAPPGMSDEQARIAAYQCRRDAQATLNHGTSMLLVAIDQGFDCMHSHGFTQRR